MSFTDIGLFRSYMQVSRGADIADDTLLQLGLDAAEALANEMTDRTFTVATGTPTARTFTAPRGDLLFVDDFVSLTSVTDASGTIDPTLYQPAATTPGHAYSAIRRNGYWTAYCPSDWPNVTVVADWGWTAIPAPVQQAVLILAKDIVANQQVSFGIAAFTEYAGVRAKENPQVAMLLAPYDLRVPFA